MTYRGTKKLSYVVETPHYDTRSNKLEIVFLLIFPFTVILIIYHTLLTTSLFFDNGNFIDPYLYGSPFYYLSQLYPWSSMIWVGLFRIEYSLPWFSPNTVYLYITSISSLTFYIFLSGLRLGKISRLFGSIVYVLNPFYLYNLYDTGLTPFFILIPLVLFSILEYSRTTRIHFLFFAVALTSLIVDLDYSMQGIAALRLVVPIIILPIGLVLFVNDQQKLMKKFKDYLIAFLLFVGLNIWSIMTVIWDYFGDFGPYSRTSSTAISFNYQNMAFNYASERLTNVLSGMWYTFTPSGVEFLGLLWFLLVVVSILVIVTKQVKPSIKIMFVSMSILFLALIAFSLSVKTGILLPVTKSLPVLYLFEYPYIIEAIQMFASVVLISLLIDNLEKAYQIQRRFPHPFRKTRKLLVGLLPIVASIVVIALLLVPFFAYNGSILEIQASGQDVLLPQYYDDLGAYFEQENGPYRVLILPLNYSSYNAMLMELPPSKLFISEFAEVNAVQNTSSFLTPQLPLPPLNEVKAVILDIYNEKMDIGYILANDSVKYVIIFNPNEMQNVDLIQSSSGEITLNGGGMNFLDYFLSTNSFKVLARSSQFIILENNRYTGNGVSSSVGNYYYYPIIVYNIVSFSLCWVIIGLLFFYELIKRKKWLHLW